MKVATLQVLLILGCSSGSSTSSSSSGAGGNCDAKAEEIRQAAIKRGLGDTDACLDTTPAVQKDFAAACADLKACRGG